MRYSYVMKLIFDFDYTLFQTSKLRDAIAHVYFSQGISQEIFLATLEQSRGDGRDWKPEIQLNLIAALHPIDVSFCKNGIDEAVSCASQFFYEDSIPFLRKIQGMYPMYLVTYGEDSHQNAKIYASQIAHLFEKIIVTKDITKVSALSGIIFHEGKGTIFIEDNPLALQEAKKAFPLLTTVRINRGEGRYTNDPDGEGIEHTIKSLVDLSSILNNLKLKI